MTPHVEQLEFQARGEGRTQCARILAVLQSRAGCWVPMPELARAATPTGVGTAVHSRVNDLRQQGWPIDHRNERKDGAVHSFYRLNESRSATAGQ